MMAFRVMINAQVGDFIAPDNPTTYILPADRCTWREPEYNGTNYDLNLVVFYEGDGTNVAFSEIDNANVDSVELGFIGKSGRFVATTV